LASNTVHLWLAELDRPEDHEVRALALLSADERQRAMRFHFERDRRRFTIARAALRVLLGRYVGRPAADIAFVYGANGKPAIANQGPQFNLAHSGELAAIAVSDRSPLGVDVESLDRTVDCEALMGSFGSAMERAAFAELPPENRRIAFFHWWTRKESVLKALGAGLSLPLDGFDVSILPGDARLVAARLPDFGDPWSLQDIDLPAGYLGCLAMCDYAHKIEVRHFET
jgi:4'-phosphopantetheinyl transferase